MYTFERSVNQTLWYAIMEEGYQGDKYFENDTFMVKPYDWDCPDEEGNNEYHFWHKPSDLKLYWYKYPLRSPLINKVITHEQFYAVLHDCMNSIHPKYQNCTFEEWWEKERK